ncbi:aldose 1-epimerase [Salinarimonas ramus]|uniref:Aldose 1-epimerase n=1 Tax=Salinarimonas ramus TaxID=690164 RepID=A0A917V1U5_9HYPH|nr:aldose 1-epimerase [Salinarimonas ramus]GGK18389.1 aldose 1-epimerase [Salinarimonas ramus]
MTDILTLTNGELALDLAPEIGGAITGFRVGDVAVMRETTPEMLASADATQTASFPLVPFSGRIDRARFAFCGEEHRLVPNFGESPHYLHGFGWRSAWAVGPRSENAVTLVLDHDAQGDAAGSWPFRMRAELTYALEPHSLVMTLAVENRDARPMPCGLGFHPYFPRRPGTTLRFRATNVWISDEREIPVRREAPTGDFDFSAAKEVASVTLDNAFSGFGGRADIVFPDLRLALAISADAAFTHCVVFVPPGKDFFCVEPVSHMPDAINRMPEVKDHGLRILAPNERIVASARIAVERLP